MKKSTDTRLITVFATLITATVLSGCSMDIEDQATNDEEQLLREENRDRSISFLVDGSGSLGYQGFEEIKEWMLDTIYTALPGDGSVNMSFTVFSTQVPAGENSSEGKFHFPMTRFEDSEPAIAIPELLWPSGWTNTAGALSYGLNILSDEPEENERLLVLITDGVPCLPADMGGCPQPVCQYARALENAGVRVIVVGFGDRFDSAFLSCLVKDPDDLIMGDYTTPAEVSRLFQ